MKEFFEFCRKRIDLLIFNISIVAVVYGCRILICLLLWIPIFLLIRLEAFIIG